MGKSGPRNVKNVSLAKSWLPPGMYMYIWWSSTNSRSIHYHQICYSTIVNTQEWGYSLRMGYKWNVVKEERRKRMTSGKIRGGKRKIEWMFLLSEKQIHLPSKGAVGIFHEKFSKLNDVMDWALQTITKMEWGKIQLSSILEKLFVCLECFWRKKMYFV